MSSNSARMPALPVETLRAIAILLLVSFHVIGGARTDGLGLAHPHPLRIYGDLFVDIRMPLFAFVAGVVYALKPPRRGTLLPFLLGKFRRLAIPGITAITVFMAFGYAIDGRLPFQGQFWQAYYRHYEIFWFLQVMLIIFPVLGLLDALTDGAVLWPALILSLLAIAMGWSFDSEVMAANRITHLLGYLLLGVAFIRHIEVLKTHHRLATAVGVSVFLAGLAMNLWIMQQTGRPSAERLDLQSLLFAGGACMTAMLVLPRLHWLSWLGAFSLTIYLYHIIVTSGVRRALQAIDVESLAVHLLLGTAFGILLPVLVQVVAARWQVTRLLVLGLRAHRPTLELVPRRAAAN
nr:acyltransferase [Paracoccus saliphilus]